MNLDEFIADIKRTTQYGNPNSADDQSAKNILVSVNDSLKKITKNWLWDWLYKSISITLIPGTTDYTLDADVASLIAIDSGNHNYLRHKTLKDYFLWHKADTTDSETDVGEPGIYIYIGRDATTGARKIRIDNIPSSTTTLTGFAKKRLTEFTDSDLGGATSFIPFPMEDGGDILKKFVLADIYRLQGKDELVFPQIAIAEKALKDWRAESSSEPASDVTSSVPSYYRSKKIGRRNGYTI